MQRKKKWFFYVHKSAFFLFAGFAALCLFVSAQIPDRVFTDSVETVSLATAVPVDLDGEGDVAQAKLFGVLPVASVRVAVLPVDQVIPGGDAIAVRLNSEGVIVIGFTDGDRDNPARKAGLRSGDVILRIGDCAVSSADELTKILSSTDGKTTSLRYLRNDREMNTEITPQKKTGGGYALGVLVRDTTAGIGTLTFVLPESGVFGSLGHGITDPDTERLFRIGRGDVYPAQITAVRKGVKGVPGELQGTFCPPSIGAASENEETGLYGTLDPNAFSERALVPVAAKEEVHEGDAVIRCTVNGTVEEYSVSIEHIYRAFSGSTKNMLIRVTDPKLLECTGGIVQGMSGSPIFQNGKMIGAVTHVLVGDPTTGYAIFIENMLDAVSKAEAAA